MSDLHFLVELQLSCVKDVTRYLRGYLHYCTVCRIRCLVELRYFGADHGTGFYVVPESCVINYPVEEILDGQKRTVTRRTLAKSGRHLACQVTCQVFVTFL